MTLRYLLKFLLLPPLAQLLGLVIAALLWRRLPRLAKTLAVLSVVSLWALATPRISGWLIAGLEQQYPLLTPAELIASNAEAIVVISAGLDPTGTEFGRPSASDHTLLRLRYTAFAQRQTGLPILVSGGLVLSKSSLTLANVMAADLEEHFRVPVRWFETESRNTDENARYSAEILASQGIDRIVLITEAFHMPRAVMAFKRVGFSVVAAPTAPLDHTESAVLAWVPNANALSNSNLALHEYLGWLVYRLAD
ncbi:YdcF family protein [Saccharospirillum mangrovi]|uniref:YdcF family protein n=1 Tax=Saccharospirillum mangrovi TaxID=2161747 RepID=UPI000D337096|nr:YdcF family protein [Saccharospirillum mangrovi]